MTPNKVEKVLELSIAQKNAKKVLRFLQNRVDSQDEDYNVECIMRIGLWMLDNKAVSVPAVEEYIKKLQSELDSL